MKKRLLLLLASSCLFLSCGPARTPSVVFHTPSGKVSVQVEIADTPSERAQGLMFRQNLPPGQGMLFVFPSVVRDSFWMRNTPIWLDLAFIREGRVVDVIENAVPFSETLLTPSEDYTQVVEVPGGYLSKNQITEGSITELP